MALAITAIRQPNNLPWWAWCKLLGWPLMALALLHPQSLVLALAAHWLMDFTLQNHQTSIGKAQRNLYVIAYHAFISGGYAGYLAGGLPGLVISVVIHFLIDRFYKPVYGDSVTSRIVDQALHFVTLIAIWSWGFC